MALMDKVMDGAKKHMARTKEKSSSRKKEESKRKEVHHFEVHPAKGGHMLEIHHSDMTEPPTKSMHKSMSGVHKEMKANCPCGGCTQEGAEATTGGENMDEED